jgi:hypothetical protein
MKYLGEYEATMEKPERDYIFDLCLVLSIYFKEPDLNKFLDMPDVWAFELIQKIKEIEAAKANPQVG